MARLPGRDRNRREPPLLLAIESADVPVGCTQAPAFAEMTSLGDVPTKRPQLYLSGDPAADQLLSEDPLALLVGMVLDQQIPLEWAFQGPFNLAQRLDARLDATAIAQMPEDELAAAFATRPALHRYPASMAKRVQALARHVVTSYGGEAARIWTPAGSGPELLGRVRALPGFGEQKAKIFVALLGKQLGVKAKGWVEVSSPFGEAGTHLSIADIDGPDALALVREHKREMKQAAKSTAAAHSVKSTTPRAKSTTPRQRGPARNQG